MEHSKRPTPEEIAYAAGLFEGEGTIILNSHSNWVYLRIKMTDLEPILRMVDIFGGKITGPSKVAQPHYKPQYEWLSTGGSERSRQLYEMMRPWLSPRRIARFEELLRQQREMKRRPQRSCVTDGRATQRGYHAHLRLGEEPCDACRTAYNLYMEQYRRGKGVPERPPAMSQKELDTRKNANRKLRYQTDPEYRQMILDRNTAAREKRRHDLA